jgi:hypothetical protein
VKKMLSVVVLSTLSAALAGPVIPQAFSAQVTYNTTGSSKSVPHGITTLQEYYDFDHNRLRKDSSNGVTKVYRYDQLVFPPDQPVHGDPDFACAKGYQFQLSDPDNTCCWLWLVDDEEPPLPSEMIKISIPKGAKDVGPSPDYGGTEHWSGSSRFPFKSTGDWYLKNGTLVEYNSFVDIPKSGTVVTETSYLNFTAGDIDVSVFAHPEGPLPHGKGGPCKEFGKDPKCSMDDARAMLAEHAQARLALQQQAN